MRKSGQSNARVAGICDIAKIISTLKNLSPQQAMINCLGGAATEVLFAYIGQWLELALDDDPNKKKDFTDFAGITGSMNWRQVGLDAGVGCLQAMNPFSAGSSKLLIASVIAGEATIAFASDLMGQYDNYKARVPNGSVKGYFDQIQWQPPIIAAGTSALAGIAIEVFKTDKFKSILTKIKKKLQTASGVSALRKKFLAIGCNDATWGKIVKFLGGACFPAKTPIYTIHGLKPIELITVKDTVYSYDETTRKYVLNKVKQTFKKTTTKLVMLYTLSGKLIASPTPEHPFFVKNTYKPAKELVKGDSLLSKTNNFIVVDKVVAVDSVLDVYNFEVENDHNYLVGEDGVLVHNTYGTLERIPAPRVGRFLFKYINPKGFTLFWNERTIAEIRGSITAKLSKGPGAVYEATVAQFVDSKNKLIEAGKSVSRANKSLAGDIDVETLTSLIECKKTINSIDADLNPDGSIKDIKQFTKYFDKNADDFFNLESKKVILCVEENIASITSPSDLKKIAWLKSKGVIIVDTLSDLEKYL